MTCRVCVSGVHANGNASRSPIAIRRASDAPARAVHRQVSGEERRHEHPCCTVPRAQTYGTRTRTESRIGTEPGPATTPHAIPRTARRVQSSRVASRRSGPRRARKSRQREHVQRNSKANIMMERKQAKPKETRRAKRALRYTGLPYTPHGNVQRLSFSDKEFLCACAPRYYSACAHCRR